MLRQATNKVTIRGILSENNLKKITYNSKIDGRPAEAIGGTIKVLVDQAIDGVPETNEIVVEYFVNKYNKKTNDIDKQYQNLEYMMSNLVSIAAAGSAEGADRVSISGASLAMSEFVGRNGKLVNNPKIKARFLDVVNRNTALNACARFEVEGVIASTNYALDAEGNEIEPKKLNVNLVVPQYGGYVDVMTLCTSNPEYIDVIESEFEPNDTIVLKGRLSFKTETEVVSKKSGFGESEDFINTYSTHNLVITGGDPGSNPYDVSEIREGLADRKARQAAILAKGPTTNTAPAPATTKNAVDLSADLGF